MEYNFNFWNDGWYTTPPQVDLSGITVPTKFILYENTENKEGVALNAQIARRIPTVESVNTLLGFESGVDHSLIDADDFMTLLLASLERYNDEEIEGACATPDYSTWS